MKNVEEIENHFTHSTKPLTADLYTRSKRNLDRIEVARVMVLGVDNHRITVALRSALNYEDLFKAELKTDDGEPYFDTLTPDYARIPLDSIRDDATDQEVWSCGRIKEPRADKSVARLNFERSRDIRTLATYVTNIREAGDVDRVIHGLNDFKAKYFGEGSDLPDVRHLIQRPSDFIEPPAVTFNLAQLNEPGILPTPRVEEAAPETAAPAPQEAEVEEGPKQRITNLGVSYREAKAEWDALPLPLYASEPKDVEPAEPEAELPEVKTAPEPAERESAPEAPESKREASTDEWVPTVSMKPLAEAPEVTQVHPDELPGTLTEHIVQLSEGREGNTSYHEELPKDAVVVDDVNSLFDEPKAEESAPEQEESTPEPEKQDAPHRTLVDEGEIEEDGAPEPATLNFIESLRAASGGEPLMVGEIKESDTVDPFDLLETTAEAPKQEAEPEVQTKDDREDAGNLGGFFDDLPEPADDHEPVKPEGAAPAKSFLDLFNEDKKQEAEPEVHHEEREEPKESEPEPVKQEEPEVVKSGVDPNKNRSFLAFLDREDPEDEKDEDEDDLGPIKPVAQPKPVVSDDLMDFLNS